MSVKMPVKMTRVEICASCLRGRGFVQGPQDREGREAFMVKLRHDFGEGVENFELKLGQCQRLCPEDRVTLAVLERNPPGQQEQLALTEGPSYDDLVHSLRQLKK